MEVTFQRHKDKLVVSHAVSTEEDIRFYINETQYFSATHDDNGYNVEFCTKKEKEEQVKTKFQKFKENLDIGLFCSVFILIVVSMCILLSVFIDSYVIFLFATSLLPIMIQMFFIVILEMRSVSKNLRSKHSAEHMMANFLETNQRLPRSIEEVKSASRFCEDCGTRKLISGNSELFFSKLSAFIVSIIASGICNHFSDNKIIHLTVVSVTFCLVSIVARIILDKYKKTEKLTEPLTIACSKLIQRINTTSKVKDRDIILAFCAARAWLELVYPEYCTEDDDLFITNTEGLEKA